jgi:TolB-like protein
VARHCGASGEDDSALALGMADALITRLGNIQQVSVRPTSAVMKYGGVNSDAIAAGRELGVEVVLDGLVQKSDKMIRVSVQLLRVADGATVWSAKFDDYFTNIFAVQDSISEKMAEALSLRLSRDEVEGLLNQYEQDANFRKVPWGYYYRGMVYAGLGEKEKALALLEEGVKERAADIMRLKTAPELSDLRQDPRFQALLKRVGFS